MSNEHRTPYRDFLADPQPRSRWCDDRGRECGRECERWSPLWRPFEGPLSASARRHAVTILKNLYGFLVNQHDLMGNPWPAVGVPRTAGPKVNAGRSFNLAQWAFIEGQFSLLRGQGNAKGADRFERASMHWMRHLHACHAIASGIPVEIAQQSLGYASLATTTTTNYVTTEARRRLKAVEKFWGVGRTAGKGAK